MAFRQYTIEELLSLRNSPLVQKPEHLPAIEQWIDESQQQQRSRPQPREAGTASPMGNFSAGQRPGLIGTRMTSKDDVSLGPPRTVFASSRTTARLADFSDTAQGAEVSEGNDSRQGRQPPLRKVGHAGEPEGKYFRESWTSARERRAATNEDDANLDRGSKFNRRDRDREREHESDRRNGFGDRDSRWNVRDDKKTNGERDRRWRSRERPRQEREWDKGGLTDREPEWMEDIGGVGSDDLGGASTMPKNQEDFEKWKQAQRARDKKPLVDEAVPVEPALEPPASIESMPEPKPVIPLQLDSSTSRPLHDWGKQSGGDTSGTATQPKQSGGKGKTSRFMPMFKRDEPNEAIAPAPTHVQQLSVDLANTSSEDKEGFQRILQMLGGSNLGPPSSTTPAAPTSPPSRPTGGARSKSRFTGFFDQGAKSPETIHAPEVPPQESFRAPIGIKASTTNEDRQEPDLSRNESYKGHRMYASESPLASSTNRDSWPQTARTQDVSQDQPQRSSATPDVNIQNLLASQRTHRPQGPDKNSEFLLNLLQTKGGSRPPSQPAPPPGNFALWLDQPSQQSEPLAPKPRMPPAPGLFEEQLLRNAQNDGMPNNDAQQRRMPPQRPPPGFFDEQSLLLQQQQQQHHQQHLRNMPEPPPQRMLQQMRRPNGVGPMPQMQMQMPFPSGAPIPPEFLHAPPPGYPQPPPPGFAAHAPRHPPGFHNMPNIFQQREQTAGNLPTSPPHNAPPGFFGGPLPQNLPPGGYMSIRPGNENAANGVPAGNVRQDFAAGGLGRGR